MKHNIKNLMRNKKFRKKITDPIEIVETFDVPNLAGCSRDGERVYIDRRIDRKFHFNGKPFDVTDALVTREVVQKALIDDFDFDVDKARKVAELFERIVVTTAGVSWTHYRKYLIGQKRSFCTLLPMDLEIPMKTKYVVNSTPSIGNPEVFRIENKKPDTPLTSIEEKTNIQEEY